MAIDVGLGLLAVGAGLAVGLAALGSGAGQGRAAAAAVGATAEDPKMFGKGLVLAGLVETQALYGLVVALILISLGFGMIVL
ncbi:MAG: V-type ATP synthase subunit K [Candidatus Aenigmarchaeota archaeon]|nr:V-type ATP synthase subunit K [Candidatus Aenigmarchaeota archaeon]